MLTPEEMSIILRDTEATLNTLDRLMNDRQQRPSDKLLRQSLIDQRDGVLLEIAERCATSSLPEDVYQSSPKPEPADSSTSNDSGRSARRGTTVKRAPARVKAAFLKPVTPDAELAAVVGAEPLLRTELSSRLWAYIKKHHLQDRTRKTLINADAALKPVFDGKSQVSMFEMTKLVSRHLRDG